MKEFWNEMVTQASWEKLQQLSKEIDFVVIGGWAAYLWTGKHKSKDINIIVDYETLSKLQGSYRLEKNERLKKYEVKLDKFDIDIYVPFFSKLAMPLEDVVEAHVVVQGIKTVRAEYLLILKQGAEIARRNSIKGTKDSIDLITLIANASIDWKNYSASLKKYGLENYKKELLHVISTFPDDNIQYLGMDLQRFKNWKKKKLEEIRENV